MHRARFVMLLTLCVPLGIGAGAQDTSAPQPQQQPQQQQQTAPATPADPQTAPAQPEQPAQAQPGESPQAQPALPEGQPAPIEREAPTEAAPQPAAPPDVAPESVAPESAAPEAPSTPHARTASAPAPDKPSKTEKKKDNDKPVPQGDIHNASLWHDPGNIAEKDLFFGPGGQSHKPAPPFTFISEDKNGTNPKFNVRDANNTKWRVKLGEEAQPEVVASRLLWAVGYYANDDYLLHVATIQGLDIHRGEKRVHNGDQVINARFERKPGKDTKVGIWEWKTNPFRDTREFNGLRVMMAVINSWDLKDVNNAVYTNKKTGKQILLVSDIGATFATNSLEMSRADDKGNVKNYRNSKFITKETATTVDFGTPSAPSGVLFKSGGLLAKDYFKRHGYDWIGDDIPRSDARWIGSLLGRLSHQQLVDAFRAANFPAESIEEYVKTLEGRIAQLKAL